MKISVITSAYNSEKTLARTIDSVLAQGMTEFEYIIVNHGSTDGTETVIETYGRKDSRVRLISLQENTGFIGKAINEGIRCAKGSYLCFIDGDDVYQPDYLQNLYDDIIKEDYDLAICGSSRVDEQGNTLLIDTIDQPVSFVCEEDYEALPSVINQTPTRYFTVWWNKMLKKSYLEEHDLWFPEDTLVHGDAIFLLNLYDKQPKMYCGNYVGIAWTQASGSTSFGTYKPAYFDEMMIVVEGYQNLFQKNKSSKEEFEALAEKMLTTVVNTKRLEHMKGSDEEKEKELFRWTSHPSYQLLL